VRPYGAGVSDEPVPVLRVLGRVESPLTEPAQAPCQGDEGGAEAVVRFADDLAPALRDLTPGQHVLLLTWLDRADRDVLAVHPRGDPDRPETGVFATRSPDRPNPLGLHPVTVLAVDGPVLRVSDLEALDGTPVVDVKPVLGPVSERCHDVRGGSPGPGGAGHEPPR
jgi:tRNA-Thr(GGU) m(6)t(6)A37 methyltransferase TsaA